jgi:hypothetical protein
VSRIEIGSGLTGYWLSIMFVVQTFTVITMSQLKNLLKVAALAFTMPAVANAFYEGFYFNPYVGAEQNLVSGTSVKILRTQMWY